MKFYYRSIASVLFGLLSGCQCCPCTDYVGNAVDDANDTHFYFDHFYNPKFDLTRMGKPDWCSPFNSMFCRRSCNPNGCYDRYDNCNLYPPLTPYEFPSYVMPPPVYRTQRMPQPLDTELEEMDVDAPVAPPKPGDTPAGNKVL